MLYQNFELREKILPGMLGLKRGVIQKYFESFANTMKQQAVQQRCAFRG